VIQKWALESPWARAGDKPEKRAGRYLEAPGRGWPGPPAGMSLRRIVKQDGDYETGKIWESKARANQKDPGAGRGHGDSNPVLWPDRGGFPGGSIHGAWVWSERKQRDPFPNPSGRDWADSQSLPWSRRRH